MDKFSNKQLTNKGKHLAFLLRHDKDAFDTGLIDIHGWRQVSELIKNQGYSKELLDEIVSTNEKQRYEYSSDKSKIRARQGHSIPVDVELTQMTPPEVLYHGTQADVFYSHIQHEGLKPMQRQYVHLSADTETATKVGSRRRGELFIIKINAKRMSEDGIKFWLSNNGVWLTLSVPPSYFIYE